MHTLMHIMRSLKHSLHEKIIFLRAARHLKNRWAVLYARIQGRPLPPLELTSELSLFHSPKVDPIALLDEIVGGNCYTPPGFYSPAPGDTVIDIGANIGAFALYLQLLAKSVRVHSFEPVSSTREVLEMNVNRNRLSETINVYPYAIGEAEEDKDILTNGHAGHSSFYPTSYLACALKERVKVITLEKALALAGSRRVALLKIDIEGSEEVLFRRASKMVWDKVDRIAVETHEIIVPGIHTEILNSVRGLGYAVFAEMNNTRCGLGYVLATRRDVAT